jgi:predicted NACHT family NTPase
MERKEKERPEFANRQEFSPEHGSEAYQQGYTEAKRVEHEAFLAEIGKRQPGEHVVILGEPGAGKTTLLMKVWEWLLVHEQPGEDIVVAWVPLAAVKNNELEDHLKKYWIKPFCKSGEIDRYWASFEELADAGRV